MKEYPWGKGTVTWVRDATANDSDKSFTVPAGKIWDVQDIAALIICTATVGNRSLLVSVSNGTDLVFVLNHTASITATQAGQVFYSKASPVSTTARVRLDNPGTSANVESDGPLPDMLLPAGYVIRVYDRVAVDAAADDLTVVLHYVEYDA